MLSGIRELDSAQHFLTHWVSHSCGHNRSEQKNKTQGDPMTSHLERALLSAALVTLAIPVVAQNTATPDPAPEAKSASARKTSRTALLKV
jgi:hypothetical protein